MADLTSAAVVGESLVALWRGRAGAPSDIRQLSTSDFTAAAVNGLSVTCFHMAASPGRSVALRPGTGGAATLRLDLQFLVVAWSSDPVEEQTMLAWAMAALDSEPILTVGAGGATASLVSESLAVAELAQIWSALGRSYRLSFVMTARGVVVTSPTARDGIV